MPSSTDLKHRAEPPDIDIGRRLAQLRRRRGISAATLAESAGVALGQLRRIERGAVSPAVDLLARLLAVLGCSIERLLAMPEPGQSRSWRALDRADPTVARRPLAETLRRKAMTPELLRLSPAQPALSRRCPGELFLLVLGGRLRVETDHDAPLELVGGDSVYLDGRAPVRLTALGTAAEAVWVRRKDPKK